MKLTEISDTTMVDCGQFLIGTDITAVQLDMTKFWGMVKRSLVEYEKYRPLEKRSQITVTNFDYTFTMNVGVGIPDWISSAIPVTAPQNPLGSLFTGPQNEMVPRTSIWEYRNPVLYLSEAGIFDIVTMHKHSFTVTGTPITEVDIPDISEADYLFLDIVRSRFLQAVGKSRRAFTMSEIPFESDGSEMVSEGLTLYDRTMEDLRENNSKWWEAVG